MRSVVVVLPASMCAMIPMLRTFSRALVATVASSSSHLLKKVGARPLGQSAGSTLTAPNRGAIFPSGAGTAVHDRYDRRRADGDPGVTGDGRLRPLADIVTIGNARRPCSTRPSCAYPRVA